MSTNSAATESIRQVSGTCPVMGIPGLALGKDGHANRDWWPDQLDLRVLHRHNEKADPMPGFDYRQAFGTLDLAEVKDDIKKVLVDSQAWWPADYGHYGPFMIRMAWHAAGTYRTSDGRGGSGSGMLRFAPLNSWPDNANLDKARRLLWPVKQKYGAKLSWGDLMILTGNCALESMGLPTFGFGGGREDRWEPDDGIYWGPEQDWLGDERYKGEGEGRMLDTPLGAVQMGLIYVNPQGSNGEHDPVGSARDIRETFGRMAMNDYETVALVAGGHTFGKAHAAGDPSQHVGPEPEGAPVEQQGFGWKNSLGTGAGPHTITSELEGAWTTKPTEWDNDYLDKLFKYEWKQTRSPAGAVQWEPAGEVDEADLVPDAHDPSVKHPPMMFTTDLSLREDKDYEPIARHFQENPEEFADAFARAWYKLCHRDMGPHERLLGPEVPEPQQWQDPVPAVDHELIDDADAAAIKDKIMATGLSVPQLVKTAFAAAGSFRGTDKRGGANGGRIRLEPQRSWTVNDPENLDEVLPKLEQVQADFNAGAAGGKTVSFADVVVLAGIAAVEHAAKQAGHDVSVPFRPGRTDATDEMTDVESFAHLEVTADAFRNYLSPDHDKPAEELMVDRADLLTLTAPEMTVLVGGLRVLGGNVGPADKGNLGVFTDRVGTLSNDFFVNLLDNDLTWAKSKRCEHFYEGRKRGSDEVAYMGTSADLVFGHNSQLRALAEVYASDDAAGKFVADFVKVWDKLMELDRFV